MNYLYKYRPFDENSIKALVNRKLWFSTGDKFNDPFDCTLNIPLALISEKEIRALVLKNENIVQNSDKIEINKSINSIVDSVISSLKSFQSVHVEIL